MADANRFPSLTELTYFQWSNKTAPTPTLARAVATTDTTIYFSAAPLDKSLAVITTPFVMGAKIVTGQYKGYTVLIYCANGADGTSGLSATGSVVGIAHNGLDYTVADADTAVAIPAGSPIFCADTAVLQTLLVSALQGSRATGGNSIAIGDETTATKSIKNANAAGVKKEWLFHDGINAGYSDDGTTLVNFADVSASVLVKNSATDSTAGYLSNKQTSASGRITLTTVGGGGDEDLDFDLAMTATDAEINQALDGVSANVTATNLNTLTGGSTADGLHTHTGLPTVQFTAGETLVAGDQVYIKGLAATTLTADEDSYVEEANPTTNFGANIAIETRGTASAVKRAFIHFDISGEEASVTKAYLKVYASAAFVCSTGRKVRAYLPSGTWAESTVTYANQPGITAVVADPAADFYNNYGTGLAVYYDVTTIYNDYWSANNYGVELRWSDETGATNYSANFHSSEGATSNLRPQLIIFQDDGNYGRVYKSSSNATAAGIKGTVLVGGAAGATVTVAFDGVVEGLTGLTPYALYKADTSGGLTLATNALDAQYLALSATQAKLLDKRKEYATDILSVTQSIGDMDIALTALPAGMILDNITATSGDTVAYTQDGIFTGVTDTPSATTVGTVGITAVDIL
jgi:hypothetical protein